MFLERVRAAEDAVKLQLGRRPSAVERSHIIRKTLNAWKKEHGIQGKMSDPKKLDEWYMAEIGVIEERLEEAAKDEREVKDGTFHGRVCLDEHFDD